MNFLLVCEVYQSTAEQEGSSVSISLSCSPSCVNATYQATTEAKETANKEVV